MTNSLPKDTVIGLWPYNLSCPVSSAEEWAGHIAGGLREAAEKGADILVLPEYACESWLYFANSSLKETGEIGWLAEQAPLMVPLLQKAVDDTGVALVAGTMPWAVPDAGKPVNRAWILRPGQEKFWQDKTCLTPFEKDPQAWELSPGTSLRPFVYKGVRYAVLICLDVEIPPLACLLAGKDIDVLLVPSQTEKLSGYHRVFSCARARAVELMCAVAVVGCVGGVRLEGRESGTISAASVFMPCEEQFGSDGILIDVPPFAETQGAGAGTIVFSPPVPVGRLRQARKGGAEAWPGFWQAEGVAVEGEC